MVLTFSFLWAFLKFIWPISLGIRDFHDRSVFSNEILGPSFIHSFIQEVTSVSDMSGTVLGVRYEVGGLISSLHYGPHLWSGMIDNEIKCIWNEPGGDKC